MRLSGLMRASCEILDLFWQQRLPISQIMGSWSRRNRYAGSRDRHNIANIIYDILRNYNNLALLAENFPEQERNFILVLLSLLTGHSTLSYEQIFLQLQQDSFAQDYFAHLPSLSQLEQASCYIVKDFGSLANIPSWQHRYWQESFGSDWLEQVLYFNQRAAIDLRINDLKADILQVQSSLEQDNLRFVEIFPPEFDIKALRFLPDNAEKINLYNKTAFLAGWFEVQDLGSQLVAKLINAKPSMHILDYCCGAGGKALAMASDMQNYGKIFAYDKFEHRLQPLAERASRCGVDIISIVRQSCLAALKAKMDIVLCDVPCSGSGTWRRCPDQKYLLTERELHKIVALQKEILQLASNYVKPQGKLCYVTCSLFAIENDKQIQSFLHNNSAWEVISPHILLADAFSRDMVHYLADKIITTRYGIYFTPYNTQSDGFYFAALRPRLEV